VAFCSRVQKTRENPSRRRTFRCALKAQKAGWATSLS